MNEVNNKNLENLLYKLNLVIDSMTDDNCKPLPHADKALVLELQEIAMGLFVEAGL